MERQQFLECMTMLQVTFGYELAQNRLVAYWDMLKGEDGAAFQRACVKLNNSFEPTSQVPVPVPAHFRKAMGDGPDDSARAMVLLVKHANSVGQAGYYRSVSFSDRSLHYVIAAFGGWMTMCNWTDEDWQLNETKFLESYKAAKARDIQGPEYLPGRYECDNSAGGHEDAIPPVVVYDAKGYVRTGQIARREVPRKELAGPARQPVSILVEDLANRLGMDGEARGDAQVQ